MNRSILDFFQKTPTQAKSKPSSATNNESSPPIKKCNLASPLTATPKSKERIFKKKHDSSDKENVDVSVEDTVTRTPVTKRSAKKTGSSRKEEPQTKRRRLIIESDNEEEAEREKDEKEEAGKESNESEYEPSGAESSSESENCPPASPEDEDSDDSSKVDRKKSKKAPVKKATTTTPIRKSKTTASSSQPNTPRTPGGSQKPLSEATKDRLSMFANIGQPSTEDTSDVGSTSAAGQKGGEGAWDHLSYAFLKPEVRRDADRKKMDDPMFDPTTIHVPEEFRTKCTPAMRQWWDIKSRYFNTILFFKVGKFYELYHMDAVTAVKELGVVFMRGSFAHSGFPEIAYTNMADQLVQKGYKVARVEQTETVESMGERTRGRPVKEKVVRREVCQLTTPGTWTPSTTGGGVSVARSTGYLLALKEGAVGSILEYGVAFVDTSVGLVHVGQFTDDRHCSRLRTLIAHFPPAQVLHERGGLSSTTQHLLKTCLSSATKDSLRSKREFWDSEKTLEVLSEAAYFYNEKTHKVEWPAHLKSMLSDSDSLGRSAKAECVLGVSALGGLVYFLTYCLIDHEIMSMRRVEHYLPVDVKALPTSTTTKPKHFYDQQSHMVLDGITLINLDILTNSTTETSEGTLVERVDSCSTPFGKRLLRQWITAPLCHPDAINSRLSSVEELINRCDGSDPTRVKLKKLPDLERLVAKIHVMGHKRPETVDHPNSRAILYEEATYSKRKIEDFVQTLQGFSEAGKLLHSFAQKESISSQSLKDLVLSEANGGQCPDLEELLTFFKNAFDQDQARKEGRIIPEKGVDEDFDSAVNEIKAIERRLDDYLKSVSQTVGKKLNYWGTGRNRYQIEVPENLSAKVGRSLELSSQRKGFKRYRSREIEELFAELTEAEDRKTAALRDVMRRIFATFDEHSVSWQRMVRCLSELDCLMALAEFSRSTDGDMCRPQIVHLKENEKPFIEIRDGRHPCLTRGFLGGDLIPNDIVIGRADKGDLAESKEEAVSDASLVLVTGANMGGKSTLMRQTALIALLAQIGCYVPASVCRLSPIDRIFTRLGASDRIMAGESTFLVELSETSGILHHVGPHSLVLVDELGRGTATYDGCAIACAVVHSLAKVQARVLFSTHYHGLVEELSDHPGVRLGHMACMVENEGEGDDLSEETITFLYKFTSGACPKSYGFNAARLAQLPDKIIRAGLAKSIEFEQETVMLRFLSEVLMETLTVDSSKKWKMKLQQVLH